MKKFAIITAITLMIVLATGFLNSCIVLGALGEAARRGHANNNVGVGFK
ncbi:hypothetical protein FACS189476_00720 [Spirochaetia bacterium]|nr:hypothetical protein FACS189476_00720 [Spirochaetia bacterium]